MLGRTPIRLAVLVPISCAAGFLAGCGSSGGGASVAGGGTTTGGSTSQPASSTSQPASGGSSGSGAKCTDLTAAAASSALGKATTVTLDTTVATQAGLTICNVTVANEVFPIQLAVYDNDGQAILNSDKQNASGVDLSGVGDQAITTDIGVDALSGGVLIEVTGPAGAVLSGDDRIPTAIAKAMIAAMK